jgi:hypothetical protein
MAVKARKPGISRIDWRMPISLPVKLAASMAKLLSSADQVENAMAFAATIRISRLTGVRQPVAWLRDISVRWFMQNPTYHRKGGPVAPLFCAEDLKQ